MSAVDPTSRTCGLCHINDTPEQRLKRCSKCQQIFYCSVKCQSDDWGNHKKTCERSNHNTKYTLLKGKSLRKLEEEWYPINDLNNLLPSVTYWNWFRSFKS